MISSRLAGRLEESLNRAKADEGGAECSNRLLAMVGGVPLMSGEGVGRTVVMFSGGRDSTLAAVRLAEQGQPLLLVTVTSSHLVGIDRVSARLSELRTLLPPGTRWLNIRQPEGLIDRYALYERTCLPCHHLYVVVAIRVARTVGAAALAFGYAGYQDAWPEQTPAATSRLADLLANEGITLHLPVYDLRSRSAAIAELEAHGLATASLEQKCLIQTLNVTLTEAKLREQLDVWESAIRMSLSHLQHLNLEVLATECFEGRRP
jgi:hypothetical protein